MPSPITEYVRIALVCLLSRLVSINYYGLVSVYLPTRNTCCTNLVSARREHLAPAPSAVSATIAWSEQAQRKMDAHLILMYSSSSQHTTNSNEQRVGCTAGNLPSVANLDPENAVNDGL